MRCLLILFLSDFIVYVIKNWLISLCNQNHSSQVARIPLFSPGTHTRVFVPAPFGHTLADDLIAGWCTLLTHLWNEASSRTHRRAPLACQVRSADDTGILGRKESVFPPPNSWQSFHWELDFSAGIISLFFLFFFFRLSVLSVLFNKYSKKGKARRGNMIHAFLIYLANIKKELR